MLRDLLGRYLHTQPSQLRFTCNEFGKPDLSPEFGNRLKFNLSHSAGLALIAIATASNVGVDLEYIRAQSDYADIARRFLSTAEVDYLIALPSHLYADRAAGVNMSLGTDTNPQSVIEAMRWAAVVGKLVERNTEATTAAHVFDAATLGGARALGRDDLGRIAAGARADLVLWRACSWRMTPLRDPVKNIVYNATDEDVDRVYVDGRLVVDGGRVLAADEPAILRGLQAAGERMWPRMAKHDWAGRGADELSPQTYPEWSG